MIKLSIVAKSVRSKVYMENKRLTMTDNVNHPSHYTQGGVECIDALAAATNGLNGIEAVCTANAIKYLWRWKRKNGVTDLRKCLWYVNHLIEHLNNENELKGIDALDAHFKECEEKLEK